MVRDRVCGSAQGGFDGRDDEQRPVVTSGVTLAGHLITDLDPMACEGIGAQPAHQVGRLPRATVQGRGD